MQNAAAEQHALQGWPAFMTQAEVEQQMTKFRVRRSVLGRRVRFLDRTGGCIEYARLGVIGGGLPYFQRVDGPCEQRASIPKFPHALAPHEVAAHTSPYSWAVRRENYAELVDYRTKKCATYRRSSNGGIWLKVAEQCRETEHESEVQQQRRRVERERENWKHALILKGVQPRPRRNVEQGEDDSMYAFLNACYTTNASWEPPCPRIRRNPKLLPYRYMDNATFALLKHTRVNPKYACAYGDPWYKSECQRLLRLVKGDKASIRAQIDKDPRVVAGAAAYAAERSAARRRRFRKVPARRS